MDKGVQLHLTQHLAQINAGNGNVSHFVKLLTIFKCFTSFNLLTVDYYFWSILLYRRMVFDEWQNGVPIEFIVIGKN
jgi:enoyl reductase-like protein